MNTSMTGVHSTFKLKEQLIMCDSFKINGTVILKNCNRYTPCHIYAISLLKDIHNSSLLHEKEKLPFS
jgi:hypothetical protein